LTDNTHNPKGIRKKHRNKYINPIVFKTHLGIFLNLRCILLNFAGLRKAILVIINKPPNSIIPINPTFIILYLTILAQKIVKRIKTQQ